MNLQTKVILKGFIINLIFIMGINQSYAENMNSVSVQKIIPSGNSSSIKTINTKATVKPASEININLSQITSKTIQNIDFSKEDYFLSITNATDKFVQRNIRASWEDFKLIIQNTPENDFYHLILANKMAELGFYDLADLSFSKIKDHEFSKIYKNAVKRFYYPLKTIGMEDEMFLAQIYSDISFNNQSLEATTELSNKGKLKNIDYANYLSALGYYKSNNFANSLKYINKAISLNPQNLNYLFLKAKIFADKKKTDDAIKILNVLKRADLKPLAYQNKIVALENYIMYKTKKSSGDRNYYLGSYYYVQNDYSKALKCLQVAASDKKGPKSKIYGLISEIYFAMQDYDKASEAATKACKYDAFEYNAYITLGNIQYKNKNYEKALAYYKKVSRKDKKDYKATIKLAKTYEKLSNVKKAKELYSKILKANPYNWETYYELAYLDKDLKEKYLRKSLTINALSANTWAELAKTEIDKNNYDLAQQYLSSAYYIDENNFKYYYYQGLVCKNFGELTKAKYNFKKCLKIDTNNPNAQRELTKIIKMEEQGLL